MTDDDDDWPIKGLEIKGEMVISQRVMYGTLIPAPPETFREKAARWVWFLAKLLVLGAVLTAVGIAAPAALILFVVCFAFGFLVTIVVLTATGGFR